MLTSLQMSRITIIPPALVLLHLSDRVRAGATRVTGVVCKTKCVPCRVSRHNAALTLHYSAGEVIECPNGQFLVVVILFSTCASQLLFATAKSDIPLHRGVQSPS